MGYRKQRVADQLHRELADLLQNATKDPELALVTVTEVRVSGDLHSARIWVSVLGDDEQRERSLRHLRHAAGFLRRQVASRIRLREVPELRFVVDDTLQVSARLERLLDQARQQHTEPAESDPEEPK